MGPSAPASADNILELKAQESTVRAQALPGGRAHTRPCGHARIPRLPRGRVWCHTTLRGQDRWHCHQPVLEGARGILARHTPLHRGARDLPCPPRLDGADRAGELFPAPSRIHSWRPRLRPCRPQARGSRRAQGNADEGTPALPPRHARGRGHDRPGAPDGFHTLLMIPLVDGDVFPPLRCTVPSEACKEICWVRHSAIFFFVSALTHPFWSSFDGHFSMGSVSIPPMVEHGL